MFTLRILHIIICYNCITHDINSKDTLNYSEICYLKAQNYSCTTRVTRMLTLSTSVPLYSHNIQISEFNQCILKTLVLKSPPVHLTHYWLSSESASICTHRFNMDAKSPPLGFCMTFSSTQHFKLSFGCCMWLKCSTKGAPRSLQLILEQCCRIRLVFLPSQPYIYTLLHGHMMI